MRQLLLTLGSSALSAAVIGHAFYQKKQFYPTVVHITKSNPSMAIIYFQAFVMVLLMGKIMRRIFFGTLRAAETEHLMERSWYAVTETCLAFTVFRDDFSPKFIALFTLLLFLKCFHWLAEDRVDYMERSPVITMLFHFRVLGLLSLLGLLDFMFVSFAYRSTMVRGPSVQVVFGFEYAILLSVVANVFIKYILHTLDLRSENPWENKAVFLLYTELAMSGLKVMLYLTFMAIMLKIHTFPLFAIRPTYLSMRALKKALKDVVMSRQAIRNMNTLYPDATAEELAAVDNVCIICREEMQGGPGNKKLPCHHIFHASCLRSWFQRQQTCPTCRLDVLRPQHGATNNAQQQQQNGAFQQPNGRLNMAAGAQPNVPPVANNVPDVLQQFLANWPAAFNGVAAAPIVLPPPVPPAAPPRNAPGGSNTQLPTTTTTNSSSSTTTTTATFSFTIPGGAAATLMPPLPPFLPPPPFLSPPPPPPPPCDVDLGALSEEELSLLEGRERAAVESRIRTLRNIQTLLDAAVMQMQHYMHAVNATESTPPHRNSGGDTAAASTAASPTATTTRDGNGSGSGAGVSSAPTEETTPVATTSTATPNSPAGSSEESDELRRLRLRKFASPETAQNHNESQT